MFGTPAARPSWVPSKTGAQKKTSVSSTRGACFSLRYQMELTPPSRHVPVDVSRLFWSFRKTALSSTRNDYFWDSECKNNSGCVAQGSKRLKKRCFLNEKLTFSETMRAAVGTASQTWCSKHFLIKRLETAPTHRHFAKSGASRNALVGAWPCFLGPASA